MSDIVFADIDPGTSLENRSMRDRAERLSFCAAWEALGLSDTAAEMLKEAVRTRQTSEGFPMDQQGQVASPMAVSYRDLKARHPDFLIFYRVGEFYEILESDAVRASQLLGLQLGSVGPKLRF